MYSAQITLVAHHPATPDEYKERIPRAAGVVHTTIEIHVCGLKKKNTECIR